MAGGVCSVGDCGRPVIARGWCEHHYRRWRKTVPGSLVKSTEERFWANVRKTDSCWLWTGRTYQDYGMLSIGNRARRAHRYSYELHVGPIPDDMFIDHRCHTPGCVNPEHLQLATPRQNAENRVGPQKRSKTGVRGVYESWILPGRYEVRVYSDGKSHRRYGFHTIEEAEAVAVELRNDLMSNNLGDRRGA